MLVLTRKVNERITIGKGIEITIIRVAGNRVRLGFTAPAEVGIVRHDAKQQAPTRIRTAATGEVTSTTSTIPRAACHPEYQHDNSRIEAAAVAELQQNQAANNSQPREEGAQQT